MIISGDSIRPSNGQNISLPPGTGINVNDKKIMEFSQNGLINQSTGQILESLWSLCDGSSHLLATGNYTVQNVTSQQVLTNTFADITGSTINYIPPMDATKVVYRFTYSIYWITGGHSITHHRLLIDNNEVIFSRHNRSTQYYQEHRYTFEWVIPIGGQVNLNTGRQASWTTAKTIKMQARNYSTGGNDGNLHGTAYWDGGGGNQFNMPIINIIAIR